MSRPTAAEPDKAWNEMYALAEEYYRAQGHLLIPGSYMCRGRRLGRWIGTQRDDYKKRSNPLFTQSRIDRLNSIGMVWDVKEHFWQEMYGQLGKYVRENGTARVPQSYVTPEGLGLGIWLNHVRQDHKNGDLSPERIAALEELGVIWEPEKLRRSQWDVKFELLRDYVQAHGQLPSSGYISPQGVKLGDWLANQRARNAKGALSRSRADKLSELGLLWRPKDEGWESQHQRAKEYYQLHGHLCPGDNSRLGRWLAGQRRLYQEGRLSDDRIQRLEDTGMLWDVRAHLWEAMYQQAREYYKSHGDLRISKSQSRLGHWISTQRKNYADGTNPLFTKERVQKLEEIGMIWDASVDSEALWESWYEKAREYFMQNSHLQPEKGKLRTWLHGQRYAKKDKRGHISPQQITRLEQIGMIWYVPEYDWQAMYALAKEYYAVHNTLNIPCSYTVDGIRLGQWLAGQRQAYRNYLAGRSGGGKRTITRERIELLNDIGMIWSSSASTAHTSFREKALLYYLKPHFPDASKLEQWQEPGMELDIYLPSISTAIEYDGCRWHMDKAALDNRKNALCESMGISLIRIREPGLPELSPCGLTMILDDLTDEAFEKALSEVFLHLNLGEASHCLARDKQNILATYRDYTARKWDRMYAQVYEYHAQHGCLTTISWIYSQRVAYKNNQLTPLQIEKLERLGMIWSPFEDRWQLMYRLAGDYKEHHGDLMIPHDYITADGERLGDWLARQRYKHRKGMLQANRVFLLEKLGIDWEPGRNGNRAKT